MSTAAKNLRLAGIGALLVVGLVGCASSMPQPAETRSASSPSPAAEQSADNQSASSAPADAAAQASTPIGTRVDVTQVLEQQLKEQNAKARWEGDTLHMSLDGETADPLNGRYCRLFKTLLEPTDSFVLEFPGGSIPCSEVPGA